MTIKQTLIQTGHALLALTLFIVLLLDTAIIYHGFVDKTQINKDRRTALYNTCETERCKAIYGEKR